MQGSENAQGVLLNRSNAIEQAYSKGSSKSSPWATCGREAISKSPKLCSSQESATPLLLFILHCFGIQCCEVEEQEINIVFE